MNVIVNAAMSVDGKLSSVHRVQIPISGPVDFERVDELRSAVDAIMVGVGTVLADDPSLTVDRSDDPPPIRIVADSRGRTPLNARIVNEDAETIVLATDAAPHSRVRALANQPRTSVITVGTTRVDLVEGVAVLEDRGIDRLLVEGGGELIFSLFAADLVDRLSVYVGNIVLGGATAPTLADGPGFDDPTVAPRLRLESVERVDEGVLLTWSPLETSIENAR